MSTPINERVMLVNLSLHQWYPRKYDKKASQQIAELNGSAKAEEVGRFNKILVEIDSIKPLQTAIRQLRQKHYEMTVPWSDDGERALPAELYFDYSEMVRDAKIEIDRLADSFVYGEYEKQRELARVRLNGLFNPDDYPEAALVRDRFGADVSFRPIPNPEDTRVWGIGDQAAKQIEQDLKASIETTTSKAQKHVINQVIERAQEFVQKVKAYDEGDASKLYETAVENLRDVTELVLKGLNVTGDQELNKMAEDMFFAINGTNIDKLKHGEGERKARIEKVEDVLDKFSGVFG